MQDFLTNSYFTGEFCKLEGASACLKQEFIVVTLNLISPCCIFYMQFEHSEVYMINLNLQRNKFNLKRTVVQVSLTKLVQ